MHRPVTYLLTPLYGTQLLRLHARHVRLDRRLERLVLDERRNLRCRRGSHDCTCGGRRHWHDGRRDDRRCFCCDKCTELGRRGVCSVERVRLGVRALASGPLLGVSLTRLVLRSSGSATASGSTASSGSASSDASASSSSDSATESGATESGDATELPDIFQTVMSKVKSAGEENKDDKETGINNDMPRLDSETLVTTIDGKETTVRGLWKTELLGGRPRLRPSSSLMPAERRGGGAFRGLRRRPRLSFASAREQRTPLSSSP